MNPLDGFFAKFAKILQAPLAQKKKIIELLSEKTGIQISEKDFEIRNNILYIKSSPALKNEIFMRKTQIMSELSTISIYDIR